MSGGALIDMGVFSDPMISNPSTASAPLLSGVLLEFHRKHRLMIALDVQVVIEGNSEALGVVTATSVRTKVTTHTA